MRRDMDTVRRILAAVADASGPVMITALATDADPIEKTYDHVELMAEAGLLKATTYAHPPYYGAVERLTWDGQDMLASIADPGVWERVKSQLRKVGGDCAMSTLKALAVQAGAAAVGLS